MPLTQLFLATWLWIAGAPQGASPARPPIGVECGWILRDHPELAPVAAVCTNSMSFYATMPNFVCDLETTRAEVPVQAAAAGGNTSRKPNSVVTAEVTFRDGEEKYSDVKVDGKTAADAAASGMWSRGEFSPPALSVLNGESGPVFTARGEESAGNETYLVFDYRIARENNVSWSWRIADTEYHPGFHGSLWIDKASWQLRRFTMESDAVDSWIPYTLVRNNTEYQMVKIAGVGDYLLPVRAESMGCQRGQSDCLRNVIEIRNCRKFAAKARIVE